MSSFTLFLFGLLVLIGGLAYAAFLAGIPGEWIAAGALALIGAGIITAVTRTRLKDPPAR